MTALTPAGSTRQWRRLRRLVLMRDNYRCQLPVSANGTHVPDDDPDGIRPDGTIRRCMAYSTHVDHVLPRALGGSDDPANLRAACAAGNLARGAGFRRQSPRRRVPWAW